MSWSRRDELFDPGPVLARFPDTSAADIAAALGVSKATVAAWRCGRRAIRARQADELAIELGTHPAVLWGDAWWHFYGSEIS